MKKLFTLLVFGFVAIAMIACDEATTTAAVTTANTAPTIAGVAFDATIARGESFDALEGVSAADAQDGDLTAAITLTSVPALVFTNGVCVPEEQGEYYITYSVIDAGGLETKEYTTLTVTRPVATETLFKDYDFADADPVDLDGWTATFSDGATGLMEVAAGRLVFQVVDRGTADYHAKLTKVGVEALAAAEYELKITMSASVAGAKLHWIVNDASQGWSPAGGIWNLELTTTPAVYSIKYTVAADTTQIEWLLQMGGDLNPAGFDLYVDKVELLISTGTETESVLLADDFATDAHEAEWGITQDAAASSTLDVTGGEMVYTIANYAPEGAPWNMNLWLNTGIDLVSGSKYKLSFDVTVQNDQFYELCFEDQTLDWQVRAGFKNGTFSGTQTVEHTFYAGMAITGLYIKLALGQGTTSNVVAIDNIRFVELVGDKTTETVTKTFSPITEDSEWDTYNAAGGVGSLYTENGNLVYSIQSFGAVDWYNKMFIKAVTLEAGALYKVSFTVKADVPVKMFFALNVLGSWDPRVTAEVNITTEYQTFTFTMDSEIIIDMDFEMLFQFGGYAENVAPAKVEFSAIEIYQLK
ncbi:MAG: hypothetical protein WC509_03675 [Candidatus Izemoplasmatales bacterium]